MRVSVVCFDATYHRVYDAAVKAKRSILTISAFLEKDRVKTGHMSPYCASEAN
jgi:hypothetical protein